MRKFTLFSLTIIMALGVSAESLPGFRLEQVANTAGFLTSIAFDSEDRLHYTTYDGGVFRLESDGTSTELARVATATEGNAAMLGMAFEPAGTIVVHYVSQDLTADILSRIDLETATETILARLQCSPGNQQCPTEHHGGNPDVAPDGTIFFGIGDYGLLNIAQRDDVHASKIYRITPSGAIEIYAKGFRNPFDIAWDPEFERIVGADNGAAHNDDEIVFVEQGQNHGWALTSGNRTAVPGMTPPVYVFPDQVAPTGVMLVDAPEGWFREGLLVSSFVTRALYYFPELHEDLVAPPVTLLEDETIPLIDVRQNAAGQIFLGTSMNLYRLVEPRSGDVDGDGLIGPKDIVALELELTADGVGPTVRAQDGAHRASWGADVDRNGSIDGADLFELRRRLADRKRPARHPVVDPSASLHPSWH